VSILSDRIVTGGIVFLLLLSPLAFGSVHPWSFAVMQAAIFLLVMLWAGRSLAASRSEPSRSALAPDAARMAWQLGLPLSLFFLLLLLQLLPLPPGMLQMVSPSTFDLYSRTLPGWPARAPYSPVLTVAGNGQAEAHKPAFLPTPDELRAGVAIPFDAPNTPASEPSPTSHRFSVFPETWFPLSLAPSRTRIEILKLASFTAVFFLVLLYPFGRLRGESVRALRPDTDFLRTILVVVVLSGLVVAALGLIQRFSWNGKILWFFVPYDWGFARPGGDPRASGPYINPDHFANYLALVFPIAVGLILHGRYLFKKHSERALRIYFALTAFLAFAAILLSLSRAGWMSTLLGLALFLCITPLQGEEGGRSRRAARRSLVVRGSILAVALFLVISLSLVGAGARSQVDYRLQQTVTQDAGVWERTQIWRDTFKMVRDFPLFGVGLGSWQELFQRYRSAPWSSDFYREAHNDYLELLAETGIVGFALLAWFFCRGGKRLVSHLTADPSSRGTGSKAIVGMLLAALGAMAFHELFDFNLQIPANALLFTVLFALALRITLRRDFPGQTPEPSRFAPRLPHASAVALSISFVLLLCAVYQDKIPYPYDLKIPVSVAEAKERVLAYPAAASSHLHLLRLSEQRMPAERKADELKAALWLDPTNPYIRDLYALALLRLAKKEEGLKEINQSVLNAPSLTAHYYLNARLLPWLSAEEKSAVEDGLKKALALEYHGALESLSAFYERTGLFSDEGRLLEEAAAKTKDAARSADLSIKAALSFLKAGDEERAVTLLSQAASKAPADPRSYQILASTVHAPQKAMASISAAISKGINNGAPAFNLYLSLAESMHTAGASEETQKALGKAKEAIQAARNNGEDGFGLLISLAETARRLGFREEEKSALLRALELRPYASEGLSRLGRAYLQESNFDRAAYYFRRYLDVNPDASDAFYHLAMAEEAQYRFAAAEEAYRRAVALAPQHDGYRQRYQGLKARVAQNRPPAR
jgi:O-antigen ligase/tetratricopeptide (TPR) repeat protein